MVALTGDTRSSRIVKELRRYGIGRMFIKKAIRPYPNEPWGFDNGAFGDYLAGKEFDIHRYWEALSKALKMAEKYHPPYMAVLPDIVGGGLSSLELSITIFELKLKWIRFPWYLAVQDGMENYVKDIELILKAYPDIVGIFLGGTDEFKKTAPLWSSLAHRNGKKFHYARAGSIRKIREAIRAGADSLDSALPLWTNQKLNRFLKALNPLRELPLFAGSSG